MRMTRFYFRLTVLVSAVVVLAACVWFDAPPTDDTDTADTEQGIDQDEVDEDQTAQDDQNEQDNQTEPAWALWINAVGLPDESMHDTVLVQLISTDTEAVIDFSARDLPDLGLEEIAPGTYTVTAYTVRSDHEIVDTIFDLVSAPAEVVIVDGEQSELTLEFARRPGTGSLWISSGADKRLVQYDAGELTGNGAPVAALDFGTSSGPMNQDLVFRPDGSMWLVRYTNPGELNVFHPAQWAGLEPDDHLPDPTLTVVNADGLLSGSTSIAIDVDDHVFVTRYNWGDLIRFDGLAATEPDPTNSVVSDVTPDGIFDTPEDIYYFNSARFDPAGNLWIGTWNGEFWPDDTQSLLRFSRDDLYQNGDHTLSPNLAGDIDAPLTVEFDSAGRLWVTVYGPGDYIGSPEGRLLRFDDPNGLSDGFTAADADLALEVLAGPGDTVVPIGIAFDNSGHLWTYDYDYSDGGFGRIVRIDVASIPGGATSVTAAAVLTGTPPSRANIDWGTFLAFNPPPKD